VAGEHLISIIDDDQSVRTALVRLIRSLGYGARGFSSAEEFVDSGVLQNCSCVITDIQMPGMSGIELAALLSGRQSAVPVIVITALTDAGLEAGALSSGAICFFRKPIDTNALLECLNRALTL
jgi:FixJ family two-component response regulator